MIIWTRDEILFLKTLGEIFRLTGEGRSKFHTNDGRYFTFLTKCNIDMIVESRLNHNQFEYKGFVFNLKDEQRQIGVYEDGRQPEEVK